MIDLLPSELWDYSLADALFGLRVAASGQSAKATIVLPEVGECIAARSARAGLVTALRSLELGARARVGVPLYCCPVVFKAITMAGYVPRFVDVERTSFCVSAEDVVARQSELDALIAVHMFGNVCNIRRLRDAGFRKPIVEDCALSLGSKLDNQATGTLGDIGVFSFRSGKYLSVGEGGAIFAVDPELRKRVEKSVSMLHRPDMTAEVVHVIKTYLRSSLRSRPLYGMLGYPLWERYNRNVEYSDKSPISLTQSFRTDTALAIRRLLDLDMAIKRQRRHAEHYNAALNVSPAMLCREEPGSFYNRYQYPIVFSTQTDRDLMARFLFRQAVDTSRPLDEGVGVASRFYGYAGDCPVAEELSKRTLVIPSYHTMTNHEVERVADFVNRGWSEIGKNVPAGANPLAAVATG